MKFKIGQVVALREKFGNKMYYQISGFGRYHDTEVFFVDGDTAVKDKTEEYVNSFWFGFQLRRLTAREAGRK